MFEMLKPEQYYASITKAKNYEVVTPDLQKVIENQFGTIPEFHRKYDQSSQCRIEEYKSEQGYIRFLSVVVPSGYGDIVSAKYFESGGQFVEYQLFDPLTKDRVSRHAFFTKNRKGLMILEEAAVCFRIGDFDTDYHIDYNNENDFNRPESCQVIISYNRSKDPNVLFPYTELIKAYRDDNPWQVMVAHGELEELEKYYRKERERFWHSPKKDYVHFPGVRLDFPKEGSREVLVYDTSEPDFTAKQLDVIHLEKTKTIIERGLYLYEVSRGRYIFIIRAGQNNTDHATWEITLFNDENIILDNELRGNWTHLNQALPATLVIK